MMLNGAALCGIASGSHQSVNARPIPAANLPSLFTRVALLVLRDNISVNRLAALLIVAHACAAAQHRYPVSGMVLSLDQPHQSVLVSHGSIPGYMDAMTMPCRVRTPKDLAPLHPGDAVAFTLVV